MVSNKIVVIRGREISVIFYYLDFSGCTLHPVYTIHPVHYSTGRRFRSGDRYVIDLDVSLVSK